MQARFQVKPINLYVVDTRSSCLSSEKFEPDIAKAMLLIIPLTFCPYMHPFPARCMHLLTFESCDSSSSPGIVGEGYFLFNCCFRILILSISPQLKARALRLEAGRMSRPHIVKVY